MNKNICDGVKLPGDRKQSCSEKAICIVQRGQFRYKACRVHRKNGKFVRNI